MSGWNKLLLTNEMQAVKNQSPELVKLTLRRMKIIMNNNNILGENDNNNLECSGIIITSTNVNS